MENPSELRYSEDHEWIKIESGNVAVIGITAYAQGELGDIVFVDVNTVGESVEAGQVFGSVEAVKTVSDLFSPVTGKVLELNAELESNPQYINEDPFGKGWIIKIELSNPSQIEGLHSAESYNKLIGA
jgi:glycine cleavage system H protein